MSAINNVSGSANLSYLQPATNSTPTGVDADGNNGSSGVARKSNFLNAIERALGQTLSGSSGASSATPASGSTSSSSSAQDPQAALQAFLQSLFAALTQSGGQGTASDNGSPSVAGAGHHHHHGASNLTANIQNLLQQLSSGSPGTSTGNSTSSNALSNLNSSFQNLINSISASQGQGASATTPNLQSFLQNLLQDLNGGQNISGAAVSTQA